MTDENLDRLTTEKSVDRFSKLDQLSTIEILHLMNEEDRKVPLAVSSCLHEIGKAVDLVSERLQRGGRLFYVGAGTSGRIGMLDAYECPPTFGTDPSVIQAVLAGGSEARHQALEEAEDDMEQGREDLKLRQLSRSDVVLGITASGRTPYVAGALQYARRTGAATIALSCNEDAAVSEWADIAIEVFTGPEVIAGSTRLKAGTAQKLVLNMITSASMIKLGKVFGNFMVDMQSSNGKLRSRSKRMVQLVTGAEETAVASALAQSDHHAKTSIVMLLANVPAQEAAKLLERSGGRIREALAHHRSSV